MVFCCVDVISQKNSLPCNLNEFSRHEHIWIICPMTYFPIFRAAPLADLRSLAEDDAGRLYDSIAGSDV